MLGFPLQQRTLSRSLAYGEKTLRIIADARNQFSYSCHVLNNIPEAAFKDLMAKISSRGQVKHGAPVVCQLQATLVRLSRNLRGRR